MKVNQLKLGAVLSYVSLFVTNIIGLVYTPIMLRLMGQAEYGLYSLVASIIGYLTVLDLEFGNAIIVYTAKYRAKGNKEDESKLHGMFLVIFTIIGVIASILGVVLYLNVNKLFGATMTLAELEKAKIMMIILTFNLAITFPLSIFGNILTAYEEFVFTKIVNIVRQLLNPIIMLPLLYMGYKSITMTSVVTILNISCLLINMIYCFKKLKIKIKFKGFDKLILKEIFVYSFWIFLAVLVDKINWNLDQFILGSVAGTIVVAIYALASQLNSIYLSFSTSISGVLLPKISTMVAKNESDEEVSNIFIKAGRLQFIIMFLVITGFVIFGKEFVVLWGGKEYVDTFIIACILMIPVTIPLIQNTGIAILQAKNMHKFRTITYLIIAILNVIISIPLAKLYGGVGTAIGTAISLIVGNGFIINIYYYKKAGIDIPRFWKNILKMAFPLVFVFIAGFIINKLFIDYSFITLAIKIIIYSLLYLFVVYNFSMNDYEKNIILKPLKLIKKKFNKE